MICMKDRVFLDTDIFLYAHDKNPPKKRDIARDLIFDVYKAGSGAVSTQVLAEFFQTYVVKFTMPSISGIRELHFMSQCRIIEQTLFRRSEQRSGN